MNPIIIARWGGMLPDEFVELAVVHYPEEPFATDGIGWEMILNIILYSPIGFLLGCLYKRIVPTILICVVLSVITEVLQLVFHRGLCETDDVIHNTLGGFLGYWMYFWVVKGVRCARA